jgi:hypothetical protein
MIPVALGFDEWISFKGPGQGQDRDPVISDNGQGIHLRGCLTEYLNRKAVKFIE